MSEEFLTFVKGLFVGTMVVGAGGILIGTSAIPGIVLITVATIGLMVLNYTKGVDHE